MWNSFFPSSPILQVELQWSIGCCELDIWVFFQFPGLHCHIFADWTKHKTNGVQCFETASGLMNSAFQSFLANISPDQTCWSTFRGEKRIPEPCHHEVDAASGPPWELRPRRCFCFSCSTWSLWPLDASELLSAMRAIESPSPGLAANVMIW